MVQKLKSPVVVYPGAFTRLQCAVLRLELLRQSPSTEKREDGGKSLHSVPVGEGCGCGARVLGLARKLENLIHRANVDNYLFDQVKPERLAYVNRYAVDHHRGWHVDGVLADDEVYNLRKLSAVVQLSPPDEYEGGRMEFMAYHHPAQNIESLGTVLVFPAFEWHRVTPVTSGARYSFVMFTKGRRAFR